MESIEHKTAEAVDEKTPILDNENHDSDDEVRCEDGSQEYGSDQKHDHGHNHGHGHSHSHSHGHDHEHDVEDLVEHTAASHALSESPEQVEFLENWNEVGYKQCTKLLEKISHDLNHQRVKIPEGNIQLNREITKEEEQIYRALNKKYDAWGFSCPSSVDMFEILKIICTPTEASIVRRIPIAPTTLGKLCRKLHKSREELEPILDIMSYKGLVVDICAGGKRWFFISPVIIGFFEFIFMRIGNTPGFPLEKLADLFYSYMNLDESPMPAHLFEPGTFTQLARTLPHEEALDNMSEKHEILDWERVTEIIMSANDVAVQNCTCKATRKIRGFNECVSPTQECCISLNNFASMLVERGISRRVTKEECLSMVKDCKDAGMIQTGDNVQHNMSFICNCCNCCCYFLECMNKFNLKNAIVTSNYIMQVDEDNCIGCESCVEACPVNAIVFDDDKGHVERLDHCLGCGVCVGICENDALSLKPRSKRVYTPYNLSEKVVSIAIERGKMNELLFNDPEALSHRALGTILAGLEKANVVKAMMAIKPLKSIFLNRVAKGDKSFAESKIRERKYAEEKLERNKA